MYMYSAESVLKNETHKILLNFDIQTDHLIVAKTPELKLVNKKNSRLPREYQKELKKRSK